MFGASIQFSRDQTPLSGNALLFAFAMFMISLAKPITGKASENWEEISVFVGLQNHTTYLPALLQEEALYLPVKELFDFVKINNHLSDQMDSVSGYILDSRAAYLVDYVHQHIYYNGTVLALTNQELLRTETNLYLRSDVFGKVFGLECNFQFRNLAVIIQTTLDLPLLRELRQQQLRNNVRKVKGEMKPDTSIKQKYPFLRLGTAGWNLVHSKAEGQSSASRFTLRLGGLLAGGEALITLNYDNRLGLVRQQQQYKWRLVNNDHTVFRQIVLGNLSVQTTASIFAPVIGMQVSNTPTSRRRSFGTYTISDHTQPNWMVELYVNQVLVNYVKADAAGFYTFHVPLVYGNSQIRLKFYGPSGEEQKSEKTIQIPFNLLPAHTLEYTLSAGQVQDSLHSRFSKAVWHYGLTNRLTLGGGLEFLSSVKTGSRMPFFYTTVKLANKALLSSEYSHGVRWKNVFTWHLPLKAQLELNYLRYTKGQRAVLTNHLEERMGSVSLPLQKQNFFLLSRLAVRQVVLPTIGYDSLVKLKHGDSSRSKYTSAELTLSAALSRFHANLTTSGMYYNKSKSYLYSNVALAYRLPHGLVLRSQFQYDHSRENFMTSKWEAEKQLSNQGMVNFSYTRDFATQVTTIAAGVHYNLSFIRTAFAAVRSNKTTTLVQSAGGSLLYDASNGYLTHNRQNDAGRGSLLIAPFLDINNNGKRDEQEPGVRGLKFHINGGRVLSTKEEALSRIADLEPYTAYLLELDEKSLGNIAWQIRNKTISVVAEPNVFKRVDVPVAVVGEVSGMVYRNNADGERGISRILVNFYDSSGKQVAQTLTENDGFFSFLGLAPGDYTARIDAMQLLQLNLSSSPGALSFQIAGSEDGAVADGFRIVLHSLDNKARDQNRNDRLQSGKAEQIPINESKGNQPATKQPADKGLSPSGAIPEQAITDAAQQPGSGLKWLKEPGKNFGTDKWQGPSTSLLLHAPTKNAGLQSPRKKTFTRFSTVTKTQLRYKKKLAVQRNKKKMQQQLRLQATTAFTQEQQLQQRILWLKKEQARLFREQKKLLQEIRMLKSKLRTSSFRQR